MWLLHKQHVAAGCILLLMCALSAFADTKQTRLQVEFLEGKGAVVSDKVATDKRALAIDISERAGSFTAGLRPHKLAPGLYRVRWYAKLQLPDVFDETRLHLEIVFQSKGRTLQTLAVMPTMFDHTDGLYTFFDQSLTTLSSTIPDGIKVKWRIIGLPGDGNSVTAAYKPKAPKPGIANRKSSEPDLLDGDMADLMREIAEPPISEIAYPAIVLDCLEIKPVATSLIVERVHPEKIHVYPGQANPIHVTIYNFTGKRQTAQVRLSMRTGLTESRDVGLKPIDLAPRGREQVTFDWTADDREFGHEAYVEIIDGDKTIHAQSEYFSVASTIWKVALQASGFLTWYGREDKLLQHVQNNRNQYLNVEEAFSWQPSSWDNLTPTTDTWWTGQNDYLNSMSGLKQWIKHSHDHGIKMITYSWPSASGPDGIEFARKYPQVITHSSSGVGLASEFFDVEDVRLRRAVLDNDRQFDDLRSGIWHSMGINRGYLTSIKMGMDEIIRSSKQFGWDGVRFDNHLGWSAMDAQYVHQELKDLGADQFMEKAAPDLYATREGNWSSEAISARNKLYAIHRLREAMGRRYEISLNYPIMKQGDANHRVMARTAPFHIQFMEESIRHSAGATWERYQSIARDQANLVREHGGHHTVVALDNVSMMANVFAAIFTFAGGSHPYLNYGWQNPMPGTYTQFATRYGEYFWSSDLKPIDPVEINVRSKRPLLWEKYVRQRALIDGTRQTIIHLITPPPTKEIVPRTPVQMLPWQRDVVVKMKSACKPDVWLLSAEPTTRAEQLEPRTSDDGYAVTVPVHHYWSMLVWNEGCN